jgi:alpha-amylase
MKRIPVIIYLAVLLALLGACTGAKPVDVAPLNGLPQGTDGMPWWNDTVFYEVFVRSFKDSNGDGIGDFNGLIEKLDYLNDGDPATTTDLGVTGLWLMPIQPSPSYHGYDVTDYYTVNPQYGNMQDFRRLVDEAHQRGMRVTIDLVLNHTSSDNPWFVESQKLDSPYRDWYIWSQNNPGYLGPWSQNVWYSGDNGFYYALFWERMPDLNYRNPAVVQEMKKVANFWLGDVGVDGFRLDAAKHIVEEGKVQENTPANHAWWKEFRSAYKADNPQAMTVGEVWSSNDQAAKYVQGDELDLVFNFDMSSAMLSAANFNSHSNYVQGSLPLF